MTNVASRLSPGLLKERSADGVWGRSLQVEMETVPEAPELEAGAQKK